MPPILPNEADLLQQLLDELRVLVEEIRKLRRGLIGTEPGAGGTQS